MLELRNAGVLLLAVLLGCTGTAHKNVESADPGPVELELIGTWLYTGGIEALTNTQEITEGLYTSWHLDGETGDFYFDTDGYQEPTGGTEGSEFFTYTRS
ncbi:MAG: hypothetical protein QGG40_12335 [Myxococcota bacterium]|jgi:hypothetical protein|nr:hypothetical protein [Myxococcota bacterium]